MTKSDRLIYKFYLISTVHIIREKLESEYADFSKIKEISLDSLILENEGDFFCIGKNIEKEELDKIDVVEFICQTIQELLPLYEACHL